MTFAGVINRHADGNGHPYKMISKRFHVPVPTIQMIIRKQKKHGVVGNMRKLGRKKIITQRLSRCLTRTTTTEPLFAVSDLKENLLSLGTDVSETSMRREPFYCGFNEERPRKTPLLSKKNKATGWDKVLWSDETKVELFGRDDE